MGEGDAGALGIDDADAEVGEMETTRLRAFFFMLVLLWSLSQYVECVYALGFVHGRETRPTRQEERSFFCCLISFGNLGYGYTLHSQKRPDWTRADALDTEKRWK